MLLIGTISKANRSDWQYKSISCFEITNEDSIFYDWQRAIEKLIVGKIKITPLQFGLDDTEMDQPITNYDIRVIRQGRRRGLLFGFVAKILQRIFSKRKWNHTEK
jgi:hypothetical protein